VANLLIINCRVLTHFFILELQK